MKMTHSMNTAQALHVPMNTARFTTGKAVLALSIAVLLSACSKPVTEAAPPQPTINGALIAFPGQKDPADLRTDEVRSPSERPLQMTGRLTWDEDATARVSHRSRADWSGWMHEWVKVSPPGRSWPR